MPQNQVSHPRKSQLFDFVNGRLSPADTKQIEEHVANCESCVKDLESLASDTLGDQIRAAKSCFDNWNDDQFKAESIPASLQNHARYEFLELIGTGGMGDVYAGKQRSMDRAVAIKVLKPRLFQNERAVARFQNEVKVAAQLNHPNIVHSYDAEVEDGNYLLVMELVNGKKLSEIVRERGPLPVGEASYFAQAIANGLAYAHGQGMIHRDVKPQNVLVVKNGDVKITDFGLAKIALTPVESDIHNSLTMEGETFGTPDYISPEQIRDSSSADQRSDVYSLGCTLYYMLAGRPAFVEKSVGEKLAGHLEKEPDALQTIRPDLPDDLVSLVESLLEKDPQLRPQEIAGVAKALEVWSERPSPLSIAGRSESERSPIHLGSPEYPTGELAGDTEEQIPSLMEMDGPSRRRPSWPMMAAIIGVIALAAWGLSGVMDFAAAPNRIAVVVPLNHVVEEEIFNLQKAFKEYGTETPLEWFSNRKGTVDYGLSRRELTPESVIVEKTLGQLNPDNYAAVLFLGSYDKRGEDPFQSHEIAQGSDELGQVQRISRAMLEDGKPVAAVCGGVVVLAKAGLLEGVRTANSRYLPSHYRELAKAKEWVPPQVNHDGQCVVVEDGPIITAGNKRNIDELIQLLIRRAQHEQ